MDDPAERGPEFLAGGGPVGALIRAKDWSATPLGDPNDWPQSLKTVVRIMQTSRYAMWMGWGPDLLFFYNDAYRPTLGVKHPAALGRPAREVWAEIWDEIGPRIASVLRSGDATWDERLLLFLERSGFPEETYHTFSYSPLPAPAGGVDGMLCVVTEETERVIGERRLSTLGDLGRELTGRNSEADVLAAVDRALSANRHDLPFALVYLCEADGGSARLALASGIRPGHPAAPETLDGVGDTLDAGDAWPAAAVTSGADRPVKMSRLDQRFPDLPTGSWPRPPTEALVVPIASQGQERAAGFLIAGLNPFRPHDPDYESFVELVAGQIGAALGNARAYAEERRRAEALAEIDRAKTTFFSNVSHEFRTPLTLMLGPMEEVLAKPPGAVPPEDRRQIEVAHRNGLRLLQLVNSLLDFSRLTAGRMQARYRPVDLAAVTADFASGFRSVMEKAGLDYRILCDPLPRAAYVDVTMWETIVINLLSNAFKFTMSGAVSVGTAVTPDGKGCEIWVRDTGVGIPAEELPRLFERFHRIEGVQGRSFEGSGIGLALVHELVDLHGGSITVESRPGHGSLFRIALPFGSAHLPAERIAAAGETASAPTGRIHAHVAEAMRWLTDGDTDVDAGVDSGGTPSAASEPGGGAPADHAGDRLANGERVLLADDNADMRAYVRRLLTGQGYDVEAVGDGAAALDAARRHAPDLVLSDVMMPRLDGLGLLDAMRRDPALRAIPIVLISARAGEEAHADGIAAGADDYLTKPFSARELLARVESALTHARMRRETEQALREEARVLEALNEVGAAVAAELDLTRLVQVVTDAATELTGAAFGAFFYNAVGETGESYTLYTLSGAPREAFADFPMPRNTAVFSPTFTGERTVRSDDITRDPAYGRSAPHFGMPKGHLPLRSYLAVPVVSRSREVLGGLFFGHPEPAVFNDRAERFAVAIAAQATVAIDNARLYRSAQTEIAERRQTEEALRESEARYRDLAATLEARVNERTHELAAANTALRAQIEERERVEQELRHAQKMEGIGQLTGGVAHDFNNLLTIIIGNLESLQRHVDRGDSDPERLTRWIENAHRGAQRAASLTQRLLAFSRRQPLEPRPIDANRLVAGMSDLLRRTLGETIEVETVLAGGLWATHADPNQLESAILNLAVNARDAMRDGGRLTIETANAFLDEDYAAGQAEVAPGQYVVLCISDTGTGMTRDVLAQAFEPFFTTKDVGHGTGLGLSQVYGFVKQSGGHVKIYSEPGDGTTVKIYLPRLFAAAPIAEAADRPPQRPSARAAREHAETILVVEDDDDVRRHSVELLSELGYRVIQAPTGPAGLALLDRHPEVVLLF
ncbi:MAG: ATP-binding protein, partial [Alphaproteobacteria bacterium]